MKTPTTIRATRQKRVQNRFQVRYAALIVLAVLLAGAFAFDYPVSSARSNSRRHKLSVDSGSKSKSAALANSLFSPDGQGNGPNAITTITVKSGYVGPSPIPGNQTFTLVKQFFASANCSGAPTGVATQDAGVNSSAGVTFAKPAGAGSVTLLAPAGDPNDPFLTTDQGGVWGGWESPTTHPFTVEPGHNQRMCVDYAALPNGAATFIARFGAGIITKAATAGVCDPSNTQKTLFNVGEQVCVQFFFNPGGSFASLHSRADGPAYPCSAARDTSPNVTTDMGTHVFTLPASDTSAAVPGCTSPTDNRGTWDLKAFDPGIIQRTQTKFRVHNVTPGHEAVDMLVNKGPTSGATVNCGSNITWTIGVQNLGPDPAQNATLVDALPASTTFQSITAPGWTCNTPAIGATGLISCTNPSLPASAVNATNPVVSTITLVTQAVVLPPNVKISNGVIVSSLTAELGTVNNSIVSDATGLVTNTTGCGPNGPTIIRSGGTITPALVTETCGSAPRNGVVDPNETVTMSFCVQNIGAGSSTATANLKGVLRATGGITNPPAVAVAFSPQPPANSSASEGCATFSFKAANVRCGTQLIATIDMSDNTHSNLGSVQWPIPTGAGGGGQPFVCCNTPTAANASIVGTITDGSMPLSGVVVNLAGSETRKTITDVSGNYRFDDVATNGFYTVTPSRGNYAFSPHERSFSQTGNETNAVFTAASSGGSVNPIDTAEYFVRQHYLDFLGREPDESGFNFWSDQMLQCGPDTGCLERSRINVSAAYFFSIEFQQTGGLVDRLYRASYDRRPLYYEFSPDARTVGQGVTVGRANWAQQLEANKQAFVDAWVERAAFRSEYDGLTNDRYVDKLVAHTGVNYSQGEKAALTVRLISGISTRADVLRQIVEDQRFVDAKRNEAFVMMQYFGYLGRDPDESGYQFWLRKLNQFNGNFEQAEMVKAFIASGEYRARFSP